MYVQYKVNVSENHLTISSKSFVKGDGSSGDIIALQGARGPSGARGLNGVLVIKDPSEAEVQLEKVVLKDPGKIGKMGPVGSRWNWIMW